MPRRFTVFSQNFGGAGALVIVCWFAIHSLQSNTMLMVWNLLVLTVFAVSIADIINGRYPKGIGRLMGGLLALVALILSSPY